MLIKNGNVIIFENDDVKVKKADIKIKGNIIKKISQNIQLEEGEKVIDAKNKIVMPGLINTHAHIPMSLFRESTEGCKLYDWLENNCEEQTKLKKI